MTINVLMKIIINVIIVSFSIYVTHTHIIYSGIVCVNYNKGVFSVICFCFSVYNNISALRVKRLTIRNLTVR